MLTYDYYAVPAYLGLQYILRRVQVMETMRKLTSILLSSLLLSFTDFLLFSFALNYTQPLLYLEISWISFWIQLGYCDQIHYSYNSNSFIKMGIFIYRILFLLPTFQLNKFLQLHCTSHLKNQHDTKYTTGEIKIVEWVKVYKKKLKIYLIIEFITQLFDLT